MIFVLVGAQCFKEECLFAGGLRVEKVASAAALKKQEVRLAHLESAVEQLTQQVMILAQLTPSIQ